MTSGRRGEGQVRWLDNRGIALARGKGDPRWMG